jgi:hypothetical protein
MSACNDNGTVICARGGLFVCCLVFRGPRGLCGADWAGPGLRCTPCAHEYRVINFCARASHGPSASPVSLLVFQLSSRAEKSLTLRRDAQKSLRFKLSPYLGSTLYLPYIAALGACAPPAGKGKGTVHDTREDTPDSVSSVRLTCARWQVLSPISRPISRLYLAYISPISPHRVERVCKLVCCASHFPNATAEWDVLMVMLAKTQDTL